MTTIQILAETLYKNKVEFGQIVENPFTESKEEFINNLLYKDSYFNHEIPLLNKIKSFQEKTGHKIKFHTISEPGATESQIMASYAHQFEVESFKAIHGFSVKASRDLDYVNFSILDDSNKAISTVQAIVTFDIIDGYVDDDLGLRSCELEIAKINIFEDNCIIREMGKIVEDYNDAKLNLVYDLIEGLNIADDHEYPIPDGAKVDGNSVINIRDINGSLFRKRLSESESCLAQVKSFVSEFGNKTPARKKTIENEFSMS